MKTFKQIYLIGLILTIVLGISACEGPAGPEGSQGEQGVQGAQGPQGEPGNANIMYSGWMDIDWHENSTDTNKEMAIHESRITANFLNDGGLVLMFLKIQGESSTLVYSLPLLNATGQFHYGFLAIDSDVALGGDGLQGIIFWLRSLDGNTLIPDEIWIGLQVRYILVSGSVSLAGKGFNMHDYDQVINQFKIKD
jgi:hypothetical protein